MRAQISGGGTHLEFSAYKNLPLIEIDIENNEFPNDKENYLNCTFNMSNSDDDKQNLSAGIRLRGNSTMGMPKKPFRIKFDKKQSLFGLTKNKSWVLLADYIDQSCIRNYTAMQIAKAVYTDEDNNVFSPTGTHVVLVINGNYQGVYLLCEQIDEKEGRTNIESDINPDVQTEFPFLVEMDRNALSEGVTGVDNFKTENAYYPIEIKYPKQDERNLTGDKDVVFDYIYEYMWAVFETLKTNQAVDVSFRDDAVTFEDLVDEQSYLDYVLINEIMGNRDNTWGSVYMYKTAEGKLIFGPIWDFDWAVSKVWTGKPYEGSTVDQAGQFVVIASWSLQGVYTITGEERYNKLVENYKRIKPLVLEVVNGLDEYYTYLELAGKYNARVWYGKNGKAQFDEQFNCVKEFIKEKIKFLDTEFSKSYVEFRA